MPFAAIDNLTDLPGLTIAGTAALLGLLLAGRVTSAVFFAVSVGGVWVLNPVLKDLFDDPVQTPGPRQCPCPSSAFPAAMRPTRLLWSLRSYWPSSGPVAAGHFTCRS
jgi:hypothetical protein